MDDLRRTLNDSQLKAVEMMNGPVLVIAGAGSGKTRVIEYRVLNLIRHKVSPNSILLLTFTRKAAREMLSRASQHDPRCKNVDGGTFHSFAYRILRKYARAIGFAGSFVVLDESDAEEAIHRCAVRMGLYDRKKRFPKKDTLRTIISMTINKNTSLGEVVKREYPHFLENLPGIEALRTEYVSYKVDKNYLDYDDLLVYLSILLGNDDIRARITDRYRYIMVDEYQDTNKIQADIAYFLAERHRNIMVVGDDAQSIYGFRGASHENIMDFPERFAGCTIIKLEQNYRSTQSILDLANSVMESMKNKYSKCLVSAKGQIGEKPKLLFFRDAYEEAEVVADLIKKQLDEGVPLGHQCVLFRSLYLSVPLQSELSKRNIPYQTFGGIKFYETAHVKDIVAHLKLLVNPKDELAWNRVLMRIERVGPKTAEMITGEAVSSSSFEEIVGSILPKYSSSGRPYSEGLKKLVTAFKTVYGDKSDVGEKYEIILEYYVPIMKDTYDDWHLRMNDLEALRQITMRYGSLEDLLEDLAVEPPERGVWGVEPETKEDEKPLVLSTIHSAKGLEWDSVVIMGLMDGVLPITFSLDNEDEIEEEQRLFYVAITRAKKRCFLTLHHEGFRGGITQFNKISRFVDSPDIMSKLEVKDVAGTRSRAASREEISQDSQIFDKKNLLEKLLNFYK
ncbi:MAG TPA: ATP-dependent helicase [Thermodesulfovibrionales bacterium]|nr:ATP-dependent helicase [Thermodesulfovibrionales bacterium]